MGGSGTEIHPYQWLHRWEADKDNVNGSVAVAMPGCPAPNLTAHEGGTEEEDLVDALVPEMRL